MTRRYTQRTHSIIQYTSFHSSNIIHDFIHTHFILIAMSQTVIGEACLAYDDRVFWALETSRYGHFPDRAIVRLQGTVYTGKCLSFPATTLHCHRAPNAAIKELSAMCRHIVRPSDWPFIFQSIKNATLVTLAMRIVYVYFGFYTFFLFSSYATGRTDRRTGGKGL